MNFIANDDIELYHSNKEYLGRSELVDFIRSPYHYYSNHFCDQKEKKEEYVSDATKIGLCVHAIILEPEKFFDPKVIVLEKLDGRSKEGKKQQIEITELEKEGKTVLFKHIQTKALEIVNTLYQNKMAKQLCSGGLKENSLYWQDNLTGLKLKARPDILHTDCIADIKTTNDASYHAFKRSVFKYNYHLQAAMQLRGAKEVTGMERKEFVLIVIENTAPYASTLYILSKETIGQGELLLNSHLPVFKKCKENNWWPSYYDFYTDAMREI